MIRVAILLVAAATAAQAWTESVEFPWNTFPKQLWERELVWLKNIGITHVSLPPAPNGSEAANLNEVIRIVRRLGIEADLESPVPDALKPLTREHGGPLTEPLPGRPPRISALSPAALSRTRELLASGASALLWINVESSLDASGYHPGAVNFAGEESAGTAPLRRNAQVASFWGPIFSELREIPGAALKIPPAPAGLAITQFASDTGTSLVSIINNSANSWKGDIKAQYAVAKRTVEIPGISVDAHDALWLPVDIPLTAGKLCKDCGAFTNADHLVYATAELTQMEYENGILAMEFAAPAEGAVILQLSREPSGPLLAGGKPVAFDWDESTKRARLIIPKGSGPGNRVRIGLAIEPPDSTGFFDNARVLLIGETNRLTAQFSSEAIAQRSRLRSAFPIDQEASKDPLEITWSIKVPDSAVHGDHTDLAIEADGMQMSHVRPQLLRPATLRFPDAIAVRLASDSALPLFPATIPVNRRAGRDVTITVRNNAPGIRNYQLQLKAEGLEFSPAKMDVVVGASTSRDVSFRVFALDAAAGIHTGSAILSGAAMAAEPLQFVVIPENGAVAYSANEFSLLESAKMRAAFMPGRWLELLGKDNNQNLLPGTGVPFTPGPIEIRENALVFPAGEKTLTLDDLVRLAPKQKR